MMAFNMTKNLIIAQNTDLIKRISAEYGLNAEDMESSYLKPEFYLVVFEKQLLKRHIATTRPDE